MKTGNTLRTARNSLLCFFMALGAGLLAACGSSGDGVAGGGVGDGTFHAKDWVVGLDYRHLNNGETGKTGERGAFSFPKGQTVAFSIGQVTLGSFVSNADEDFVTPTRIVDSGTNAVRDAVRIERLLIALDGDESSTNGTITLNANSATDATIVWNALTVATASSDVIPLADGDDGDGVTVARSIPSVVDATRFLRNTNNCAFSGAFEGTWRQPDGSNGETALVLLAFNTGTLSVVNNPLGDVRGVDMSLRHIAGADRPDGALYFNLWKEGGGPETNVVDFGGDAGVLPIGLSTFPVTAAIETSNGMMITLTVESYNRMTYTSAQETGEYRRVESGHATQRDRDADYRLVGFYSDDNNDETPVAEAEIGIYAFSANEGGGIVRPYVGWFSSPLTGDDSSSVYSNIGEGGLSSQISYTWMPEPGVDDDGEAVGRMVITDDGDPITVAFTHSVSDGVSNGYGAFQHDDDTPDGTELLGGWCAL